jgi:shikimate dehydrogenase
MMIRAGVIGYPIAQSRSPMIHGYWLRQLGILGSYERFEVVPGALPTFIHGLRAQGLVGCNCTIPHKEAVLALADEISPAARAIGAANTLWFEGGRLMADNTDAPGFLANLDDEAPGWDADLSAVMVLGAGGAARGILYALLARGAEMIFLANRTIDRAEALASAFGPRVRAIRWDAILRHLSAARLLVNTTALGMKGQPALDIDLSPLNPGATVSDIVYVPLETGLLQAARAQGLRSSGGLGMLLHQAVPGFEHWFGQRPSVTPELRALLEADLRG